MTVIKQVFSEAGVTITFLRGNAEAMRAHHEEEAPDIAWVLEQTEPPGEVVYLDLITSRLSGGGEGSRVLKNWLKSLDASAVSLTLLHPATEGIDAWYKKFGFDYVDDPDSDSGPTVMVRPQKKTRQR